MCDCIKKQEERIKDHLSEGDNEYKDKKITKAIFLNTVFFFNKNVVQQFYTPMELEYDMVNRKGETVHKKGKIQMSTSYCPFCGEKYD